MHPAWIDPGAEYDPDEVAVPELKQVERLDRLNLHILYLKIYSTSGTKRLTKTGYRSFQ